MYGDCGTIIELQECHQGYMLSPYELPAGKVHGANMGAIWVLSAPGGPNVSPINLAIWAEFNMKPL